jgi:hypothetical protein
MADAAELARQEKVARAKAIVRPSSHPPGRDFLQQPGCLFAELMFLRFA